MKKLISCAQARQLDADTRIGAELSALQLMEGASLRLWDALAQYWSTRRAAEGNQAVPDIRDCRIVALCGSGDNGADAMAILRHAWFYGAKNLVAIVRDRPAAAPGGAAAPLGPAAASGGAAAPLGPAAHDFGSRIEAGLAQKNSLVALGIRIIPWALQKEARLALDEACIVLDGIAGSGLSGPPRAELLAMIQACNQARSPKTSVVSIDLPSGLSDAMEETRICVHADATLSLLPLKAALYAPATTLCCGLIIPVGGVFPLDGEDRVAFAHLLAPQDIVLQQPNPALYKTSRGRVAVFAGSAGYTGAAKLCARSSLAGGAGYVALFADKTILPSLGRALDDLVLFSLFDAEGNLAFTPSDWDMLLIGPGWGTGQGRKEVLRSLLESGLPAVLDADAIRLFADLLREGFVPRGPIVITPHPGEFAAWSGISAAAALADPAGAIAGAIAAVSAKLPDGMQTRLSVILKSHVTWIYVPETGFFVWPGLEAGLAVAGSGDVLAGLLAGTWAAALRQQGIASQALCSAVVAHGQAGRHLRAEAGWFGARALVARAARILGAATSITQGKDA